MLIQGYIYGLALAKLRDQVFCTSHLFCKKEGISRVQWLAVYSMLLCRRHEQLVPSVDLYMRQGKGGHLPVVQDAGISQIAAEATGRDAIHL